MSTSAMSFKVTHTKPFFPSQDHALKYIEQTVKAKIGNLPEVLSIECEPIDDKMSMQFSLDVKSMDPDRISVIENRVNKTIKNISKKYNSEFTPIRFN